MDTNELRYKAKNERMCNDQDSFFDCKLHEYLKYAADRIDELEAALAEYNGAKVVEVDSPIVCDFQRGFVFDCRFTKNKCPVRNKDFDAIFPSDCPLRKGAVIVKMKKE